MANDPPFSFRAVQVFSAVTDAQSVTLAAKRLGMSVSSVSQQLSNLETALGARLVERSSRHFRLTHAGVLFRDRASALLDDVTAAKAELAVIEQSPNLHLRIATIEEFDAVVTPHWLGILSSQFPNMTFSVASGASHENHDALANRSADLILAVDAIDPAEWVTSEEILRDAFVLITPRDIGRPESLEALLDRQFIRYASDLLIGRRIEAALRRARLRPVRSFDCTSNRMLFTLVAQTGGWAISTALAFIGTPGVEGSVRAHRLPLPAFSRRLSLHARRDALGALPVTLAGHLRVSIRANVWPRCGDFAGLDEQDLVLLGDAPK